MTAECRPVLGGVTSLAALFREGKRATADSLALGGGSVLPTAEQTLPVCYKKNPWGCSACVS